ncbi:MAG: C25 family cysteine peptidase [Candidatus Cloacimonadaceae bacterium]
MKSLVWLIVMLSAVSMIFAASGAIAVSGSQNSTSLLRNNQSGLAVDYTIGTVHYLDAVTNQGNYTELAIEGYTHTNTTGLPKLPLMRKIIRVPLEATIMARVTDKTTTTVSLASMGITNPVLPRQESVAKCDDPALVPFVVDNTFYNGAEWTTEPTVKIEEIGMMRGARLVALDFVPVQYNPASAQLEIITSATVEVSYPGADWAATDELYERYYSSVFETNLAQSVFNYTPPRTSLDRYPLGMIIVTPNSYITSLQPFIDWKTQQGYNVTVATTETLGATTSAIKAYLQNIWDTATTNNPAPSYLLIVGDTPQVPAWTGQTSGGHVTDLTYVRLQGTDYVPEMYYGRFSATSTTHVQTYVEKTLQYEMYSMPDPSYLSHTVLIAGADANFAPTHGNGQINYGKNNYFGQSTAPDWIPYGPYNIRNHMYLYPASASSDAQILADMSAGLGYINYTAHGSETTWSDPTVTISNINAMTNNNKYFVAVGNCCLTNHFNTTECFGEAFTRAPNKGAVAYIGGTNSTYWDEDYYWAVGYKPPVVGTGSPYQPNRIGAYDALFHTHDEAFADWGSTVGSMIFMGNMAVVAQNSSRINYYWEIYSVMGDPSLIPYMGIPLPINAQYAPTVQVGTNSMQLLVDPYTYVAISKDNVLHGVGLVDASGALTLNFTPFTTPGPATLVMTRSLSQPTIATVQVTAGAGPYLLVNNMAVVDGNNSIPESGETIYLELVVNNVGTATAQNVTVTMTTTNPYVSIINGTANIASIAVNTPTTISNTFQVAILTSIPDQEEVEFNFTFTAGADVWTADRSITVNAPNLAFSTPSFFDPNNNGAFEQGETITVTFSVSNTGHMNAAAGHLDFIYDNSLATLSANSFTLPGINTGVVIPLVLDVTISPNATTGSVIPIGLALTAGAQIVNSMIALPVGATMEGFESAGFTAYPWINPSTIPWTIDTGTNNVNSGTYAAKSGAIGNNGMTELSITLDVGLSGEITFYRRVSSESGYDFLKFYIDNTEMGSWSGNQPWMQMTYPVSAGQRTFKWTYSKDYATVSGYDCAWIDDVVFPVSGNAVLPMMYLPTTTMNFSDVQLNVLTSQDLLVRNLGTAALTGTISVPALVDLSFNGTPVSDTYNYSIPAFGTGIFTISLLLTAPAVVDEYIVITSNDAAHPTQQITLHIATTANDDDNNIPAVTKLEGNYPNPFNPSTTIRFGLKEPGQVAINIYNNKGQLVRTLVSENKKAGMHSVVWNGTDNSGKPVSSGVYLYRMQAEGLSQTRKMMLMK